MLIKELIAKLSEFDGDTLVQVCTPEWAERDGVPTSVDDLETADIREVELEEFEPPAVCLWAYMPSRERDA